LTARDFGDLGVGLVIEVAQNDCHALLGWQCGQESVDFVALGQLFA
jgi:hypothetical protein